jgi:hypothetical protein
MHEIWPVCAGSPRHSVQHAPRCPFLALQWLRERSGMSSARDTESMPCFDSVDGASRAGTLRGLYVGKSLVGHPPVWTPGATTRRSTLRALLCRPARTPEFAGSAGSFSAATIRCRRSRPARGTDYSGILARSHSGLAHPRARRRGRAAREQRPQPDSVGRHQRAGRRRNLHRRRYGVRQPLRALPPVTSAAPAVIRARPDGQHLAISGARVAEHDCLSLTV